MKYKTIFIGIKDKTSITKAVYYPPRSKIIYWLNEHDKNLLPRSKDYILVSDPKKKIRNLC